MARQPQAAKGRRRRHRAEDNGARQRRLHERGSAAPPRHDVVDLECDADAEQQRQRDDVREIERQVEDDAEFERHHSREQQRHQRHQHIGDAPQGNPQQQRDRREREDAGLDKGAHDRVAGLVEHRRGARRIGLDREHGRHKFAQYRGVFGIALWQDLHPRPAIGRNPIARQFGRDRRHGDRLGMERRLQPGERQVERRDDRRFDPLARRPIGLRQLRQ